MPRWSILSSCVFGSFILSSCGGGSDAPTGTPGGDPPTHSSVAISASLSASASAAASALHSSGLDANSIRIVVTTNAGTPLRDTTIAVGAAGQEVHFTFDVAVSPGTTITVSTSYSSGSVPLYSGTTTVSTYDPAKPPTSIPTATIAAAPTAAGASAKKVTVTGSAQAPTSTPVTLVAKALTDGDVEIPNAVFGWSVDDPTVATVNGSGVVQPTSRGGTVVVTAVTLSGASATFSIAFYEAPARIVAISGDGQRGRAGLNLPLPFVVEVQSSSGAPVPGQSVTFGAANGSTVTPATATTDANGRAQTTIRLPSTAGTYGSSATTGAFSVSINATAFTPTSMSVVGGGGQTAVARSTLATPIAVRVVDADGVPTAGVSVSFAAANDGSVAPASAPTDANGIASTTWTLGPIAGAQTMSASVAGLAGSPITASAIATAGPGTALQFVQSPTNVQVGVVLSPAVVVRAVDAEGNLVPSFNGSVTLALPSNPTRTTFSGTTTRNAVQGVATFDDLRIGDIGSGFTMQATASGVITTVTAPFDVTRPPFARLNWTNPNGGSWSVPSNWSLNRVPEPGDTAVVALPGTYTVTLDTTYFGAAVVVGGAGSGQQTLALSSRTLFVSASFETKAGGVLRLSSAQVGGGGTFTNGGTLLASGATSISSAVATTNGSLIRTTSEAGVNATLTIENGFTNNGTIDLTATGASGTTRLLVKAGTLVNASSGVLSASIGAGGSRELDAELDNRGALTIAAPLTLSRSIGTAASANSGNITADADVTLRQAVASSFTNSGTIRINPLRTWQVLNGAFTHQAAATLNGGGKLALASSAAATIDGPFTLSAIAITSAAASFQQNISTSDVALTLTDATWGGTGTLTNPAGATLSMVGTAVAAPFVNAGSLILDAANTFSGPFTTASTSSIEVKATVPSRDARLTVVPAFTNNGTIQLSSAGGLFAYVSAPGGMTNAAGAVVVAAAGAGSLTGPLTNAGTISANTSFMLDRQSGMSTNSGTINVTSGTLRIGGTGTLTNTGTMTVAAGASYLVFGGALTIQAGSTLSGAGTLTLSGTVGNFNAPYVLPGLSLNSSATANLASDIRTDVTALSVQTSTINGPGRIVNPAGRTLSMQGMTIGATSGLVNSGTVNASGLNAINGSVTNNANASLVLNAQFFLGPQTAPVLTVASGFTNDGSITLTTSGGVTNVGLAVTSGPLTNSSSGTITSLAGSGGMRFITANVVNNGTITVVPNGVGVLRIGGTFSSGSTAVLNMELGGAATTQYDVLQSDGATMLGGTLNVSYINGYTALSGASFAILKYASVVGAFTTTNLPAGNWTQSAGGAGYQIERQP